MSGDRLHMVVGDLQMPLQRRKEVKMRISTYNAGSFEQQKGRVECLGLEENHNIEQHAYNTQAHLNTVGITSLVRTSA